MDIIDTEKLNDQEFDELKKALKLLGKKIRNLIDDFDKKHQYRPYIDNYFAGEKQGFRDIILKVHLEEEIAITG